MLYDAGFQISLLKDIVIKTAIYFDPNDTSSILKEDIDLIEFYTMFEIEKEEGTNKRSKWLLRIEFDRDSMFNKNITMDDVRYALQSKFNNEIHLIYSDYNSDRLIMRIRLSLESKTDKEASKDGILFLK